MQLSATVAFSADDFLKDLAHEVQARLKAQSAEIAHLKMTFSPDSGLGEIAVVNLVRNDFVPELSMHLEEPVESGQLVFNLRAEAAPEILAATVREALSATARHYPKLEARLDHLEHFRPGKPVPTHRFAVAD